MTELLNTLYVTSAGTSLHLDGDALRVVSPERPGRHLIPLVRLDHIVAWNGVDLSDDLLHRCAADGRSVTWVTRNGRFLGRVSGPQTGNPLLRLAQFRAYEQANAGSVLRGRLWPASCTTTGSCCCGLRETPPVTARPGCGTLPNGTRPH